MTESDQQGSPKVLWTKETHYFFIEILVGKSWTKHGNETYDSYDRALADGKAILDDSAVSAFRVVEDDLRQVRKIVFEDEKDVVLNIPKKFTPTGKKSECPLCTTQQPIASDGNNSFIFCGKCDRALPV